MRARHAQERATGRNRALNGPRTPNEQPRGRNWWASTRQKRRSEPGDDTEPSVEAKVNLGEVANREISEDVDRPNPLRRQ